MRRLENLDARPEKRSYWAIVNDYNFNTAICELVDNPLDAWLKTDRSSVLEIRIDIDIARQKIIIEDNSGGIAFQHLPLLVRPGGSSNPEDQQSIGIFGVGSKRSVVSLAKNIQILTRCRNEPAYQVEYGDDWLSSPNWEVPCFEGPSIEEGRTAVKLVNLRQAATEDKIRKLIGHLGEVYGEFIQNDGIIIQVNETPIGLKLFDNWSFASTYHPREIIGNIDSPDGIINFSVTAGLLTDSEYSSGDYGVFFYCNGRLIIKSLKIAEVGFTKGEIGTLHHSHSAARVVVSMYGPAKWMPWNSSKSGINFSHETFLKVRPHLFQLGKLYFGLSKRLQKQWRDDIFPCIEGEIEQFEIEGEEKISSSLLPPLPSIRPSYAAQLSSDNKTLAVEGPWRKRYVDAMTLIHSLQKQRLSAKNDFTLLMMDGILELALKDYLLLEQSISFSEVLRLLADRSLLIEKVREEAQLPSSLCESLTQLSMRKNNLFEESRTTAVGDKEIEEYRTAFQLLFRKIFGMRFPDRSDTHYT